MPLLRFDIVEGRSADQIKALLSATHNALVAAFQAPDRDRYQIVHEHPPSHFLVEDTGLGFPRTQNCVVLQVTTRPRDREAKEAFYRLLCERLKQECGIEPCDVVVSFVTNSDKDWSFGHGRAQFLTGELEATSLRGPGAIGPGQLMAPRHARGRATRSNTQGVHHESHGKNIGHAADLARTLPANILARDL